ncbi:MAG: hypothetical protein Q7P63_11635 [Verrucomicrobiota bacterium JB022]|nr:hypothetical protein [Verrucomicrobiota bacterium JB022]
MPELNLQKLHPDTHISRVNNTSIHYYLICEKPTITIEVPDDLRHHHLSYIPRLPKNLLQINQPISYQRMLASYGWPDPVNFGCIFKEDLDIALHQTLSYPIGSYVILCACDVFAHIDTIKSARAPVIIVPSAKKDLNNQLTEHCRRHNIPSASNLQEILQFISAQAATIEDSNWDESNATNNKELSAFLDFHQYNSTLDFRACSNNLHQIMQLFGAFSFRWNIPNNDISSRTYHLAQTHHLTKDALFQIIRPRENEKLQQRVCSSIIASPSINRNFVEWIRSLHREFPPELKEQFRIFKHLRLLEQDHATYLCTTERIGTEEPLPEIAIYAMEAKADYANYIDFVGYLHSSFECSPYLRLPLKGSSLNDALSYFHPDKYPSNPTPKSVHRRIARTGSLLANAIATETAIEIQKNTTSIVAISDLPIEWTRLNGVPLSFLKDVCRIPETGPTNILNHFNRNLHSYFEIGEDLPSKTLVVCGTSPDDPIGQVFAKATKSLKGPWRLCYCDTLDSLITEINAFRPQLLILDTHGRYTSNETGTELQIGSDRLTGDIVADQFPQIPLVILSSCWGAPLYGCTNTIAHAFFETGTYALTCSLLPVDIALGTMLYCRVLNNLTYLSKKATHSTWNEFISHVNRTSYLSNLVQACAKKNGNFLIPEIYLRNHTEWSTKLMFPHRREITYKDTFEYILKSAKPGFIKKIKPLLQSGAFLPEFLLYTTFGRADLIRFKNYADKYYLPSEPPPTFGELHKQREEYVASVSSTKVREAGAQA